MKFLAILVVFAICFGIVMIFPMSVPLIGALGSVVIMGIIKS